MRTVLKNVGIGLAITAGALLLIAVVIAVVLVRPLGKTDLRSRPKPAADYAVAVARIQALRAQERNEPLSFEGQTLVMTHGSETETSVVIFHGFTDVPKQFELVAQGYYDSGANVYVPRLPFHGYSDRMTTDPSKLTPELLRQFADGSVDIAHGLGRNVVVVGMSGGGAMTLWSAAERPDVAEAIVISPLVLPAGYKPWMVRPAARALLALPDQYQWWTDKQAAEPGPEYPRYSLRGIASFLLLAERAANEPHGPAGDPKVVVVRNLGDPRLDMERPIEVARSLFGDRLTVVEIPTSEGLGHDVVGYWGEQRPRLQAAYRYLEQALGIELPDPLATPEPAGHK